MRSGLIRHQHLFLKLAIFVICISSGFEVSLRQLAAQALLIFFYISVEPQLFRKLLFALRKLITWFTAYWVFALLFAVEFPVSLMFSIKIIYLVLITVAVWASVDKPRLWADIYPLTRNRYLKSFVSYALATYLFLNGYLALYNAPHPRSSISGILDRALNTGKTMHEESSRIEEKVNRLLSTAPTAYRLDNHANLYGLLFLCLFGIVYSL